ncbi:MAG: hypothetical protein ACXV5Q_15045 [Frankiaceae bacterium]
MRIKKMALAAAVALACVMGMAAPAAAAASGPVSSTPVDWTPKIATSGTDGTVETIRQLVPCGNTMYAVGTFTQIKRYSTTYSRNNVFSFNATTGAVSGWNPDVTGSVVDSIALSADCSTAYLGGVFSAVGTAAAQNIAAVSTATGALVTTFAHSAAGRVAALLMSGKHLLAGGYFTGINGSTKKYMVSLNPSTGRDDAYVDLNVSGNYQYTDAAGNPAGSNPTRVWNFAPSPDRTKLLVTGDFTSVGNQGRRQIFMLDLAATSATVNAWYSSEFNQNCATDEPFWLQDASWSPDQSRIYIATTGYQPASGPGYGVADPRAGLCDAAAGFPSAASPDVKHLWVNYTGCDSLYSTTADASTVYVGGHQRWANNPSGCDVAGRGAIAAPGIGGLSPGTGTLTFNPTRDRGLGADDMLVTQAGLWIASDNGFDANACGKTNAGTPSYGHAGICFLPY